MNTMQIPEAKQRILNKWQGFSRVEEVTFLDSLGRFLAEDIVATIELPGFKRSTVDGFAVRASDTFGATEGMPAYLKVAGEVSMGTVFEGRVQPGQAVQIPTGGAVPGGCDAVLMLEHSEWLDEETVGVLKPVSPGENVIRADEDMQAGQTALAKGHFIRPQELGILSALGILRVKVYAPLKAGIISTGNEIISPEQQPLPGQVRDINSYTLFGLVKNSGGIPRLYGIVKDDFQSLKSGVARALTDNDLVLISGGSSVGARDYTVKVLEELGKEPVLFHGLPVKPGKPTVVALVAGKPVFGLPGHPVSAMVIYNLLVDPLLKYGGYDQKFQPTITAVLAKNVVSAAGRKDFVRVRLIKDDQRLLAEPVLGKSGLISTFVKADGLIHIPLNKEGLRAGETVQVKLI